MRLLTCALILAALACAQTTISGDQVKVATATPVAGTTQPTCLLVGKLVPSTALLGFIGISLDAGFTCSQNPTTGAMSLSVAPAPQPVPVNVGVYDVSAVAGPGGAYAATVPAKGVGSCGPLLFRNGQRLRPAGNYSITISGGVATVTPLKPWEAGAEVWLDFPCAPQ